MESMDGDCPLRSEGQGSAEKSSRPVDHPVSFTVSTIRLHMASAERCKAAIPGWQPVSLNQVSKPQAGASHKIAVEGFCLLDGSSKGPMPSIARQPGLMLSPAPESREGEKEPLAIDYLGLVGEQHDKGVVPLITVGSVFALTKMRLQVEPHHMPEAGDLWQALSQPKDKPLQWLLDAMVLRGFPPFFGSQRALQGGKVAYWLTKESAQAAKQSRDLFGPNHPADRLPHSPPDTAGSRGKRPMRGQGALEKGYPAGSTLESKVIDAEVPLGRVITMLRTEPAECGFQLEPDEEKSAQDTHTAWQRRQQSLIARDPEEAGMTLEGPVDSISTVQSGLRQESESTRRGEMPVFRLPGVQIRLPTAVGMGVIRVVHARWLVLQRRSERRQLRLRIERLAAALAGVRAGPAPPPATASAARPGEEEDEEGMDEPPEVKHFLQELGEGGRAAPEPGLPDGGLPASGAGFLLVSCASGTLSLGLRCIEQVCNQADRLFSLTPVGRRALGSLPDPLISVHSLGALAERTNAQNVRVLYDLAQEYGLGPPQELGPPASGKQEASSADSIDAQSAAGERGPTEPSESSVRDGRTPQEQDNILQRGSNRGNGMSDGAAGDASSADNISSTVALSQGRYVTKLPADGCSDPAEQNFSGRHKASRLGAFFGRLRRRKPPPPVQSSQSSESDPPDVKPQSPDKCSPDTPQHAVSPGGQPFEAGAAGQNVPRQVEESSASEALHGQHNKSDECDAEQHAASSSVTLDGREGSSKVADAASRAPRDHASASAAGDGSAPELPDVRLDWDVMHESMHHSLLDFLTTVARVMIAQSLGVHVRVAPSPEGPKGRSQGSWSHHQEQDDSAESDAPHVASEQGLERAIVPFPEPEPGKRNDAAAPGVEEDQGDTQVVFNANKVAGVIRDHDDEAKKTLQGLLLVGNLNIEPKGDQAPWHIPTFGLGNAAHLAWADLRCASEVPHEQVIQVAEKIDHLLEASSPYLIARCALPAGVLSWMADRPQNVHYGDDAYWRE